VDNHVDEKELACKAGTSKVWNYLEVPFINMEGRKCSRPEGMWVRNTQE
jgi:hypothetical protein